MMHVMSKGIIFVRQDSNESSLGCAATCVAVLEEKRNLRSCQEIVIFKKIRLILCPFFFCLRIFILFMQIWWTFCTTKITTSWLWDRLTLPRIWLTSKDCFCLQFCTCEVGCCITSYSAVPAALRRTTCAWWSTGILCTAANSWNVLLWAGCAPLSKGRNKAWNIWSKVCVMNTLKYRNIKTAYVVIHTKSKS